MNEQSDKGSPQSRVKKGSSTWLYLAAVVAVLLIVGSYFLGQMSPARFSIIHQDDSNSAGKSLHPDQTTSPTAGLSPATGNDGDRTQSIPGNGGSFSGEKTGQAGAGDATSNPIGQQMVGGSAPQQSIDEINSFYAHIDKQPYIDYFAVKESSKTHFSMLLQKLLDNPPVVIRETDDLFTLLQNTAHFYRILGKENIKLLKEILATEQNSLELTLKSFYSLTNSPEYLKKEYGLSIPPTAITDYAAFFLNTMGGRLYLFRRDSTSRMLVSYYSIMVIDRANQEGRGGHGIDLRPAITSLIEEIENGGNRLQLKAEYLDSLYDLQEKYN
jgi:hypothetical protein